MNQIIFDKNFNFKRLPNRIRTRFIAVVSLLLSSITFGAGCLVFLYMKSPSFENQLLGQVIKHLRPIINKEIDERFGEIILKLKFNN